MGQVVRSTPRDARVRVQASPHHHGLAALCDAACRQDRTLASRRTRGASAAGAPGGDLNQAVVVGSIYRADHPSLPADSADVSRTRFLDSAVMGDRAQHHWRLAVPAGQKVVLELARRD